MINWEKTQAEQAVDLVFGEQITLTPIDVEVIRCHMEAPPDKCNIPTMPLWAPVEPLEGCECQACQRRRGEPANPGNEPPIAPPELFAGLRNGLVIMAVAGIVYLAFALIVQWVNRVLGGGQ